MSITVFLTIDDGIQNAPTLPQFTKWCNIGNVRDDDCELAIRLCHPDEIQTLNRDYRHKDKTTNVLSFPHASEQNFEPDIDGSIYLGDIIICHEVVLDEAQKQGKSVENHYAHLTIHGLLHLLGYDHIKEADAELMESLEIQLLNTLNIANPYEENHTL